MGYNSPMVPKSPTTPPEGVEVWTVSQLTRRVKGLVESKIGTVWVSGEISNWRVSPAGHAYFTLKDEASQLSSVMFRGKISKLRFEPENGLEVILNGLITVYEQRGAYQIICETMQPQGVGALQLAFEQLRAKLDGEGLFDEALKKSLPLLPRRIGVVTSPTGAAIRDILNVINRRYANVHVIVYPARVQGDEAAGEIVEGIRALEAFGVDVMIVGRGGGSLEDLWPFNEEIVVRAIHAATTPVISAVGHEIDFTLSDFAADLRAPTPSAAAELVVQEHQVLSDTVFTLRKRLATGLSHRLTTARNRLDIAQSSYVFRRPDELLRERRQRCDDLRAQLERASVATINQARQRYEHAARAVALLSPTNQLHRARVEYGALGQRLVRASGSVLESKRGTFLPMVARLDALSPLAILSRGYSITHKVAGDELVHSARQLSPKDRVSLRFAFGGATAVVEKIELPGSRSGKTE